MVMCPCVDGLSHNEAEEISKEWAAAGADVLFHAVIEPFCGGLPLMCTPEGPRCRYEPSNDRPARPECILTHASDEEHGTIDPTGRKHAP